MFLPLFDYGNTPVHNHHRFFPRQKFIPNCHVLQHRSLYISFNVTQYFGFYVTHMHSSGICALEINPNIVCGETFVTGTQFTASSLKKKFFKMELLAILYWRCQNLFLNCIFLRLRCTHLKTCQAFSKELGVLMLIFDLFKCNDITTCYLNGFHFTVGLNLCLNCQCLMVSQSHDHCEIDTQFHATMHLHVKLETNKSNSLPCFHRSP